MIFLCDFKFFCTLVCTTNLCTFQCIFGICLLLHTKSSVVIIAATPANEMRHLNQTTDSNGGIYQKIRINTICYMRLRSRTAGL